jgi:hypothetical protein
MKRYWRGFGHVAVFFIFSTFNVHVRAGQIQEPKKCLSKNAECAVYNSSGAFAFKMQQAEVRLAPGASVVRKAPNLLRIVRGDVLVKANSEFINVETLFGRVAVREGAALISAGDDAMALTNLSSEVRYRPRGGETDLDLPKGLMNEIGRVGTDGQALSGYPRSMSLKPLIEVWSKCFKKQEFKTFQADFEHFLPTWRAGLDFVGPWYRETVTREIAEHEAELARQKRLREAREKEEGYYREMFRRKNFLD